jgi:two-component system, NarL family, sensor histidine kinase UhpB
VPDPAQQAPKRAKRRKAAASRGGGRSVGARRDPALDDAQRKAILNNIPDQAWLKDADCRYIAVNRAYVAACGMPERMIVGSLPSEVWPPELAQKYLRTDREVLETGRRRRYEEQRRDRNGELRWYETIKTPVRNREGGIIGTAGISRDITDRKTAERELIDSRAQLRELSAYLQDVREAERTRISRELHDELGQNLTALRLGLDWAHRHLPPGQDRLAARLVRLRELSEATVRSLQTIASELRPGILDDLGLVPAIEWLVESFGERTGIAIHASVDVDDGGCSHDARTAIFRILQEALTNACRHADAKSITVDLRTADEAIELAVADDGRGIAVMPPGRRKPRSLGLLGMHERANMVGGRLSVTSEPGRGTVVSLRIPCDLTRGDGGRR